MTATLSPLSYVYDGRQCLGFILRRGKLGFEAIDREEVGLGMFKTPAAAAKAVFDAATSHKKGKDPASFPSRVQSVADESAEHSRDHPIRATHGS